MHRIYRHCTVYIYLMCNLQFYFQLIKSLNAEEIEVSNCTELTPVSRLTCDLQSSCSRRTQRFRKENTPDVMFARYSCECDPECGLYGDCCEDAETDDMYTEGMSEYMTCKQFRGIQTLNLSIYVIEKCPGPFPNPEIKSLCESHPPADLRALTPVSDARGVLYANIYCALCHEVPDVTYWNTNITCEKQKIPLFNKVNNVTSEEMILQDMLSSSNCYLRFEHPHKEFYYRFCKPAVSHCPASWNDSCIREKCEETHNRVAMVYQNPPVSKIYKNYYCAVCNGMTGTECMDRITKTIPTVNVGVKGLVSLSVLVDFNSQSIEAYKMKKGKIQSELYKDSLRMCPYKHVFVPDSGRCEEVLCPGEMYFDGAVCQRNLSISLVGNFTQLPVCPVYIFLRENYSIDINTSSLITTSGDVYREEDYFYLSNGSVIVCNNHSRNYSLALTDSSSLDKLLEFDTSQSILSAIGQSLSIVALAFQLFVYAILPPLRNLAGKNLMCLVAALLVAQLSFLTGVSRTGHYGACLFAACVIHYSFLASFFWMNIMSFDIWHTFSRCSRAGSHAAQSNKIFLRYSMYGWLSPGLILILSIILNFTLPRDINIRPAYAEGGVCWISNKWGLIVLFLIPLLIIIISNVTFYGCTVYNIQQVSKSTKIATGDQSNTCRLLLYIKLCLIMGLAWIFAFLAAIARVPVLWYVFIIFNSYQGVFICLAFVLTRNVIKMLKEKWYKCYSQTRQNTDFHDIANDKSHATKTSRLSLSHTLSHTISQDSDGKRKISKGAISLERIHDIKTY